ncbi:MULTISPECIES: N-acetyltransferase [unclassified Halomonas]|uniref:GNAT family N-acetyltransferase n=1 Tax=unclassified Halomonas TaxID=2609666 RepID=UPI0020A219D4|nr:MULTISPECIES: GNAT family N-acetyltransferase [unclassified Halomonas]MCP1312902.1 GNAT family N-acetyltransferase [Halomonas sp. 707D7]MCP1327055.1 GNAT family N-acetyltransferase [Halomonas sp. 707D4]
MRRTRASIQPTRDRAFASALIQRNMGGYYQTLGLHWDETLFARQWRTMESYQIVLEGRSVGLLCLDPTPLACYLRELQIAPGWQRRGVGRAAVNFAASRARKAGSAALRLRVFCINPAVAFYARLGFEIVDTADGTHYMERRL